MSGIAGFVNLDGKPAALELLGRMAQSMAHRGPDAINYWIDGPVGFAHLMLQTTPESLHEMQPLAHEHSGVCIAFDGRVDNRDELLTALAPASIATRVASDAEITLAAYERWGEDCAARIVGDFAFAIWDSRERRLFCARDLLGIRPLYYSFVGGAFRFSSELHTLLEAPGFQARLNSGMLGELLCDKVTCLDETLYQGILRLPPAHRLVLRDGAIRLARYFEFDPGKTISHASDADYAEHFFELFKLSVGCRLRSPAPVALFLSGGLDSCSILGMAAQLREDGAIARQQLVSYTLTFSDPKADESRYVREAVALHGFDKQFIRADEIETEPLADAIRRYRLPPDAPNLSPWQALCKSAARNGSRVSLWGLGGDDWLTGDTSHCADMLRQLRLPTLLRQFQADRRIYSTWGEHDPWQRNLLQWCIFPLVPRPLKSAVNSILGRKLPRWISPEFARTAQLRERLQRQAPAPPFPTVAQQRIHAQLNSGHHALEKEELDRMESCCSIEGRHPFHDRRLIEFALALPEDQRWRFDQTKYVLRQAMQSRLPNSIRLRKDKAEFGCLFAQALAREGADRVFQSLRLAEAGFVDRLVVEEMYRRYRGGDDDLGWPLWALFAAELWLRNASIM